VKGTFNLPDQKAGNYIEYPGDPVLSKMSFGGWFEVASVDADVTTGTEWKLDNKKIDGTKPEIILKAKWNKDRVTVTFIPEPGDEEDDAVTFTYNGSANTVIDILVGTKLNQAQIVITSVTGKWTHNNEWYEGDNLTAFDFKTEIKDDIVLTAGWTRNNATVTFVDNDGFGTPTPATKTIKWGDGLSKAEAPAPKVTNPNYVDVPFLGWALEDGSMYEYGDPIKGDTTFTAVWDGDVTLTVLKDKDDPEPVEIPLKYGATDFAPETPEYRITEEKDFWTWVGWQAEGATALFDFSVPIKKDTTIIGQWKGIPMTVTFHGKSETKVENIAYGSSFGDKLWHPVEEGYAFGYWTIGHEDTDTQKYEKFDENTVVKSNMDVFANSVANAHTLTIDPNAEGATKLDGSPIAGSAIVSYGATLEAYLVDLKAEGKKFIGWKVTVDGVETEDVIDPATYEMPDEDVIATAQWKDVYTVTLKSGNSEESFNIIVPNDIEESDLITFAKLNVAQATNIYFNDNNEFDNKPEKCAKIQAIIASVDALDPTKKFFAGWFLQVEDGEDVNVTDSLKGDNGLLIDGNVTIYAEILDYKTLTFNVDGGTVIQGHIIEIRMFLCQLKSLRA
jgi:hypothetical protein